MNWNYRILEIIHDEGNIYEVDALGILLPLHSISYQPQSPPKIYFTA